MGQGAGAEVANGGSPQNASEVGARKLLGAGKRFNAKKAAEPGQAKSADLLVSRAGFAAKRGNHEKELALLGAAIQLRPQDCQLHIRLAQALRKLNRQAEAAERCRLALACEPGNGRAARLLDEITGCEKPKLVTRRAQEPKPVSAPSHDKEIRKIRKLRKEGQPLAAEERCRQFLQVEPDHLDASIELAVLLRHRQDFDAALAALETVRGKNSHQPELLLQIAQTLRGLRRYDEARNVFEQILGREPGNLSALHGVAKLALRVGEWKEALGFLETLATLKPGDAGVLLDIANVQFEMLRYEDAEATLRHADELAGAAPDQRYLSRKFEYFCVTGQWERAQECFEHWPSHSAVPRGALGDVVRFYAERDRWHDVVDFLRERIIEGGGIGSALSGETLLNALAGGIRHTGRYAEALEILDRWPGEDSAAVQNLREQIVEEVALLNAVGLRDPSNPHRPPGSVTNPVRAERRALLSRTFSERLQAEPARQDPNTIYFCADAKYILGAAVSLFSLLRHNPGQARNCAFIVYCPPGLMDFASLVFGEISASMQAEIAVRSSATLLGDGLAFRTKWGAFTLGRGLSIAAYYRIFAATQLMRERPSGRALYIDSDTIIGPGVEALLRFDMEGLPLAVRREETDGPGVMRACARLGLTKGEYFNSGILLLDLAHPALESALDRSVEVAIHKQHLLTMVDQCALNVGFQKLAASLPAEFNFFVRDGDRIELSALRPVVTHYTAHPKPWDPCYQSHHCLRWFEEFEALGRVLSPERMKQLYSYSFPQRHGAWKGEQIAADGKVSVPGQVPDDPALQPEPPVAATG